MAKKRILIYSQTFFPDHSGISIYASDFAFYCAENGYDVDVITGFPFYPQWKKRDEDKRKIFSKEIIKGVSIYRGYLYVPHNPNSFQRIMHELSLVFFAFLNSFKVKSPDIIVVFTTPVLLGVLASFMNLFWRRKLLINVQDFQIEAAYSLGMLKKSFLLKIINKLELWSYREAQFVSSITASMVELLTENKGVPKEKTLLWPNWLKENTTPFSEPARHAFRQKYNLDERTQLIGYAGNIGKKQGLDVLIDIAGEFSQEKDLLFLIIGEGADLEDLKSYAESKSVTNILFLPFLDEKAYHEFLLDANAVFISQVKVPFDIYFPSKLLGVMAIGQLLIINADSGSELYKTMKENGLALVSEYRDVDALRHYINLVINDDASLTGYKLRSKKFVKQFDRNLVLSTIVDTINVNNKRVRLQKYLK